MGHAHRRAGWCRVARQRRARAAHDLAPPPARRAECRPAGMAAMIEPDRLVVIVRPHWTKGGRYTPKFEARLGDHLLCISREPLLASARVLLAEGVDPTTPLAMRHEGQDHDALSSTVGAAAKLTVAENDTDRLR